MRCVMYNIVGQLESVSCLHLNSILLRLHHCSGTLYSVFGKKNVHQKQTETGVIAAGEQPRQPVGHSGIRSVDVEQSSRRASANVGDDQAGTPPGGRMKKRTSRHQPTVWRAGSRAIRHSSIRADRRVHVVGRAASHAESSNQACHTYGARRRARQDEARD